MGTQGDNMKDMFTKGRLKSGIGEKHRKARLKEDEVFKIRKLHSEGMRTKDISDMFFIPSYMVYQIRSNKTWKHLLNKE